MTRFPRAPGLSRTIIPWSPCAACPADHQTRTFMAYDDKPTCLEHALALEQQQELAGEAAAAMKTLRRKR